MRNERILTITEVGLAAALAFVLHFMGLTLPINVAGGEVSLAMLPIVVVALRRGVGAGVVCGTLVGLLAMIYKPYIVHPIQAVLDYPAAFAAVGLAGVLAPAARSAAAAGRYAQLALIGASGAIVGGVARLVMHFASGMVFFAVNAPQGQPVWLYSLVYNGSYMLPSIVACAAAAALLVPALERALPSARNDRPLDVPIAKTF